MPIFLVAIIHLIIFNYICIFLIEKVLLFYFYAPIIQILLFLTTYELLLFQQFRKKQKSTIKAFLFQFLITTALVNLAVHLFYFFYLSIYIYCILFVHVLLSDDLHRCLFHLFVSFEKYISLIVAKI